jgi:hypothetical protein
MLLPLDLWHRVSLRTIVTLAMGAIYFLKKFYLKQVRKKAKNWPCTPAKIEHTRARTLDQDEGKGWVGELAYSYCVNGAYYAGFHHFPAKSEVDAERLIEGWKDRDVMVHYKANDPSISMLLIEEHKQHALMAMDVYPWFADSPLR